MPFTKAMPAQAFLKFSMYGPPGSGKTFTALLMAEGFAAATGKRIAYIDTERGTDFYATANKARPVHPEAFDFDALYTRSISDALDAVRELDTDTYGVVIVDSISHIWQAAIDAYEGRMVGQDEDKIPIQAWSKIKRPYKELVDRLISGQFHAILAGRQKNLFEDGAEGFKKVGVGMKAEGETQYEPTVCLRMSMAQDGTILMQAEKDRTGIISGRTFANPDFSVIAPMLSVLGDTHHGPQSTEEDEAKDSELLAQEYEKRQKKVEKSAGLLANFQASIAGASTTAELGAIGGDIKKQRRYLTEDHRNALRALYGQRLDAVVTKEAGSPV